MKAIYVAIFTVLFPVTAYAQGQAQTALGSLSEHMAIDLENMNCLSQCMSARQDCQGEITIIRDLDLAGRNVRRINQCMMDYFNCMRACHQTAADQLSNIKF